MHHDDVNLHFAICIAKSLLYMYQVSGSLHVCSPFSVRQLHLSALADLILDEPCS